MTNWTPHRVIIAVLATDGPTAAKLWRFLDPDEGGERTFHEPNYMRGGQPWTVCCTQLETDLEAILRSAHPRKRDELDIERKVRQRRHRLRGGETPPDRVIFSTLRQRMMVMRIPDDMTPEQVLAGAGFERIPVEEPGSS